MIRCDICEKPMTTSFYSFSITKNNSSMTREDIKEVCPSCCASIEQHIDGLRLQMSFHKTITAKKYKYRTDI